MGSDPLVERKLAQMRGRLARVRAKVPASVEAFEGDVDAQEILSFNFLLALQDALDAAARVIAEEGWEVPVTAREHFDILASHRVFPPSLARELAGCAGVPNLIAHSYDRMDLTRLYAELPAGIAALEALALALAARGARTPS